ncbi:putative not2 family protein [Erysiphe neolycopersici]|uniref:Putative not2 family protein n=1 Tax=Erysiphe neolycopersici TaxID=212602 RepID=A0A420HD38_9PEZI|nr:putative not2 family protein [Erysiphe neolycopersici]
MNRSATGPQSMRTLPNGFPNRPQIIPSRSVSSRIPPGSKMASNGATWAFGGGIPMSNASLAGLRPSPMTSFAQTIGGSSVPSTPLDLSEFPSLSDNQPQQSQSAWTVSGARNIGHSQNIRLQQQPSIPIQQQDDIFSTSSQISNNNNQGGFRFGTQNSVSQVSQTQNTEEFPPLGHNANDEIGQDRGSNLMPNTGFSAQSSGLGFVPSSVTPSTRINGLLNAISNSSRANSSNVPTSRFIPSETDESITGVTNLRSFNEPNLNEVQDHDATSHSNPKLGPEELNSHALISRQNITHHPNLPCKHPPNIDSNSQMNQEESKNTEVQDILSCMSEIDRWGLKGLSMMMNNFPTYAALVTGSDLTSLGFDLSSSDLISNQIYSLWDNDPPRPAMLSYKLPECYTVSNVAQLETKMANFNDEALIFMFYSSPGDIQQVMAAQELHNRNWRYHKKLQVWLTKDEMMVPQSTGNGTERGYYIFFDIKNWQRERRELTLVYDDLESQNFTDHYLGR